MAAKVLPAVNYQYSVTYKDSLENTVRTVYRAIAASDGYQKMIDIDGDFEIPVFSAIIGSGAMNMNPAIVCATIECMDDITTKIYISGSAKEGLIKKRTAEKAVLRIVEGLNKDFIVH